MQALASDEIKTNSNDAYRIWSDNIGFADFLHNDRTMQRLKSGRGFDLIENKAVADAIIEYDRRVRNFYLQQELMNDYLLLQGPYQSLFDAITILKTPHQPVPLSEDGIRLLSQAYTDRSLWAFGLGGLIAGLEKAKEAGEHALAMIDGHYPL